MLNKLMRRKTTPTLSPPVLQEILPEVVIEKGNNDSALLQTVTALIREGIWSVEYSGLTDPKPIQFSAKALQHLGSHRQENISLVTLTQMIHPDDREAFRLMIRRAVSHGSSEPHQLRCSSSTDRATYRWIRISAEYCADHNPPRLVGILDDINEEIAQNRRYDIVSTRFDLAREMLNDGLWDLDIKNGNPLDPGNVFWWSLQLRRQLGFETVEEFPDVMESWSSRLHPQDKEQALKAFIEHLMDHTGKTGFDTEYRLKLRSGEYRWFQARGQTRRAADGTPLRAVGALIDIQSRKDRLTHEKNEADRRVQMDETVKEIAGLVSENGNIAAQIKIISLNASIEAARAGVHGRGFSVIASAIRALAERTAVITGNIDRLQMRIRSVSGDSETTTSPKR